MPDDIPNFRQYMSAQVDKQKLKIDSVFAN